MFDKYYITSFEQLTSFGLAKPKHFAVLRSSDQLNCFMRVAYNVFAFERSKT